MKALKSASQERIDGRARVSMLRSLPSKSTPIDFWSNDYLGLGSQPAVAEQCQFGSTGSRLLSGNSKLAEQTESQIARFHGFEAGLLFNSGYTANLGLLSCITGRRDTLILDELAHASLIDGARLSPGRRLRFEHNNVDDLSRKLRRVAEQRPDGSSVVVVEGIYSMDGDQAPLVEILELCERFDAAVIVDEAHSIGVIGEKGEGLVASLGVQDRVAGCVYTFGKAVGYHGAVVAGGSWLRQHLINFCRPFIYSTAPPPSAISTIQARHARMVEAVPERVALRQNITDFRRLWDQQSSNGRFQLTPSESPIQALVVGDVDTCKKLEADVASVGISAKAILSPTVALGSERIRICLHAYNTAEELELLVDTIFGCD